MPFTVKAYVDDHLLTSTAETAKEAFAIAVDWQVAEKMTDISISDGSQTYSIAELVLIMKKGS